MKTTAVVSLLIAFSIAGCVKIAKAKYKLNREFNHTSKAAYLQQVSQENNMDPYKMLYIDSSTYMQFARTTTGSVYYGSFINDSTAVKKPDFLLANEQCIGRMDKEIERIVLSSNKDTLITDTSINLGRYNFYSINDDRKVDLFQNEKKMTVVLIYSYPMGTYYKSLYKEIETVCKKNAENCDLYIVTLDPLYYLRK